ncbi:MAG TPA: hydantoinase B/oxoprolinase family protein [Xanthobacteraceae bacterium]|nr:hydantoinase B/oxoprolinase family protein [Xanthobacteraceae bacterium]
MTDTFAEPRVDSISISVFQRRLRSITEEMALTLLRTTRSPILREGRDCATGLYDREGRMLEQTEYTALLGFALMPSLKFIISYFGDDIHAEDVILHNDVYSEGNQLADIGVYKPVFFEGELVGWAAAKGHQADIGGSAPGAYNPRAREIWHEGLRLTPLKIIERGTMRRDLWDFLMANVRLPLVGEDLKATIGACTVGERRLQEVLRSKGAGWFHAHREALLEATERRARAEVAKIPDGVYRGEAWLHFDAVNPGKKHRIVATVTVEGEEIWFDFTGSDPETEGYANSALHASTSGLILSFLMLIDPDIPHNEGLLRPIHMNFPKPSIVNCTLPHATSYGNHLTHQIANAVHRALAAALPERVTAGWDTALLVIPSGYRPGTERRYVDFCLFACKGGSGGTYGVDGYDHIGTIMTGGALAAQDPEVHEIQNPHLIEHYEYLPDSAGAGKWRGGYGTYARWQMRGEKVMAVTIGQGSEPGEEPHGLFGGKSGTLNRVIYHRADGTVATPLVHDIQFGLDGCTVEQFAGGGGGYGDPYARDAALVASDVRDELLSITKARNDYGVVLDPLTLQVDVEATSKLRAKRSSPP